MYYGSLGLIYFRFFSVPFGGACPCQTAVRAIYAYYLNMFIDPIPAASLSFWTVGSLKRRWGLSGSVVSGGPMATRKPKISINPGSESRPRTNENAMGPK